MVAIRIVRTAGDIQTQIVNTIAQIVAHGITLGIIGCHGARATIYSGQNIAAIDNIHTQGLSIGRQHNLQHHCSSAINSAVFRSSQNFNFCNFAIYSQFKGEGHSCGENIAAAGVTLLIVVSVCTISGRNRCGGCTAGITGGSAGVGLGAVYLRVSSGSIGMFTGSDGNFTGSKGKFKRILIPVVVFLNGHLNFRITCGRIIFYLILQFQDLTVRINGVAAHVVPNEGLAAGLPGTAAHTGADVFDLFQTSLIKRNREGHRHKVGTVCKAYCQSDFITGLCFCGGNIDGGFIACCIVFILDCKVISL